MSHGETTPKPSAPLERAPARLRLRPGGVGRFSESIARYLGTARFLVWQTGIIIVWITYNVLAPDRWQFDPWARGLVLLTLVLSLQASYAAPLILLAQNRQEAGDHVQSENDREVADRTKTDTEFLAREIAGVRLMLADVVTGEELREPDGTERGDRRCRQASRQHPASRALTAVSPRRVGDSGEPLQADAVTQHVVEDGRRREVGIRRGHHANLAGPSAEQGDHRRGDGRC